jgi:cytochrome o ubiquinol oxidase operon protein cyoD
MTHAAKSEETPGSAKTYTIGFGVSILLTAAAFLITSKSLAHGWALIGILLLLAVIQLFVQLAFFLHLAHESKPRWNLTAFAFAVMVVLMIVVGSLWIMKNLSYDHHAGLSPEQTDNTIIQDEGYRP